MKRVVLDLLSCIILFLFQVYFSHLLHNFVFYGIIIQDYLSYIIIKIYRRLKLKFHHISLRVRDFEKSLNFYTVLAGLTVAKQFSAGGGNIAYLQNAEGETQIEIIALPEGQNFEGKGMFLCFATDDLDAVHTLALQSGFNPSDIRHPEPTARYFYVYDPDGVSVQFREYK